MRTRGENMQSPQYRAYIVLKNGAERYGAVTFPDVDGALLDAARIIDACKQDSACEWRNDIQTYGAERV